MAIRDLATLALQRAFSAIVLVDIAGYNAIISRNEKQGNHIRKRFRMVLDRHIAEGHGRIIQLLCRWDVTSFPSMVRAVHTGLTLQKACQKGETVSVRFGLHVGDIVYDG